jgi:Glycosyl transferases group 1
MDRLSTCFSARLRDKTVLVIHPAWHTCGSHRVFCSQATAHRALGARVISLAIGPTLRHYSLNKPLWNEYYEKSSDLLVDERLHTGPSRSALFRPRSTSLALKLLGANYAEQMAGLSALSPLPSRLRSLCANREISLIHCNHFFNMPAALKIKEMSGAPIILETHDVQAKQYELRNATSLFRRRRDSFETLLETELAFCRSADYLVHINADEKTFFASRLPEKQHALLYPCVRHPLRENSEEFFLIVASANHPNYLSIKWFLDSVVPLVPDLNLRIVGNIDQEFRNRAPNLYNAFKHAFSGSVENLDWFYSNTAAVLLPTVAGHGLSIKTVEALLTGKTIIATPLALRGIESDFGSTPDLYLAETATAFAAQIKKMSSPSTGSSVRKHVPQDKAVRLRQPDDKKRLAREVMLREFSFQYYLQSLANIVDEVLDGPVAIRQRKL